MPFPTVTVKDSAGITQTINTLPSAGQQVAANSLPVVIASDQSPVKTIRAATGVVSVDANTAYDASSYPEVEFQFTTGTVSVTRSLNGTDYVAWKCMDGDFVSYTTASTPGIYSVDGGAWLKFSANVSLAGRN